MRRLFRILVLAVLGGVVLALGVFYGVPWYVNSGRATPRIEALLADRAGLDISITGLHMAGWVALSVDALEARRADGLRVEIERARAAATLRGLRARHIDDLTAARVRITLPEQPAKAAQAGVGLTPGQLPSVGHVAVDAVEVVRRGEVIGHGAITSEIDAAARSHTRIQGAAPAFGFQIDGTLTVNIASGKLSGAAINLTADWPHALHLVAGDAVGGAGNLAATLRVDEQGRLDLGVDVPSFTWRALRVGPEHLTAEARLQGRRLPEEFRVTGTVDDARYGPDEDPAFRIADPVQWNGSISTDWAASTVSIRDGHVQWPPAEGAEPASTVDAEVRWGPGTAGSTWTATLPPRSLETWAEYVPALARLIHEPAELGGSLGARLAGEWGAAAHQLHGRVEWTDGAIMLTDFRQAAGVDATVEFAASQVADAAWTLRTTARVPQGEALWDALYVDVAARPLELTAQGTLSGPTLDWYATTDLGPFGRWRGGSATKWGAPSADGLTLGVEELDVGALVERLIVPLVSETRPWTEDLSGSGRVTVEASISATDAGLAVQGVFQVADATVLDPTDGVGVRDLTVDLPFRLGPGAVPSPDAPPELGSIRFAGATAGPLAFAGAKLPLQVWDNTGVMGAPYRTTLLGGTLVIDALWGAHVLTPERAWQGQVTLDGIDLMQVSEAFDLFPIHGTLGGRFSRMHFANNVLDAEGAIDANVYGGAFKLTRFGILDATSPYRTFTADVSWTNIDLSQATSALQFGRVTGILGGYVHGLQIQAGQPAAFEADFQTVPTPGVPQTISVEAVNNIAVLANGRGLGGLFTRGLATLFDEYRYEHIGFHCRLENDRFYIMGGRHGPEGDYFVRGTRLPPTINVIHHDPDRAIPFREMVRRVSAVATGEARIGTPDAKGAQP